jgi:hypothetical protein
MSLFVNQNIQGKYTVEPAHSSTPLATCDTQEEAIVWAKRNRPNEACHVARVRHLNDKNKPDHWRKVH